MSVIQPQAEPVRKNTRAKREATGTHRRSLCAPVRSPSLGNYAESSPPRKITASSRISQNRLYGISTLASPKNTHFKCKPENPCLRIFTPLLKGSVPKNPTGFATVAAIFAPSWLAKMPMAKTSMKCPSQKSTGTAKPATRSTVGLWFADRFTVAPFVPPRLTKPAQPKSVQPFLNGSPLAASAYS